MPDGIWGVDGRPAPGPGRHAEPRKFRSALLGSIHPAATLDGADQVLLVPHRRSPGSPAANVRSDPYHLQPMLCITLPGWAGAVLAVPYMVTVHAGFTQTAGR